MRVATGFLAAWRSRSAACSSTARSSSIPLLALWAVFQRRYLRRSPGKGLRLTLGLLVPPLLTAHVVSTRVAAT